MSGQTGHIWQNRGPDNKVKLLCTLFIESHPYFICCPTALLQLMAKEKFGNVN